VLLNTVAMMGRRVLMNGTGKDVGVDVLLM
jgi:hypothetical protein